MLYKYFSVVISFGVFLGTAYGAEYSLAVQPMLAPETIDKVYKPLADYLSEETGETIKISSFRNFKHYFTRMKRLKGFDLVLDAAHFTDYRIKNMDYKVLAKLPDTVSLSIVTRQDLMLMDREELLPYKIATMPSPYIGGLRLHEMFPDPNHRPTMLRASDSKDALDQVKSGNADAAIVPTLYMQGKLDFNILETTNPIPQMGLSVSPKVPAIVAEKIRAALVEAKNTTQGQKMLKDLSVSSFEPASAEIYAGYDDLLKYMSVKYQYQTVELDK